MFSGSGQKWTKKLSGQHTSRIKMPVLKLVNSIRMWVADNDNKKFLLMQWGNYLSVQAKGGVTSSSHMPTLVGASTIHLFTTLEKS